MNSSRQDLYTLGIYGRDFNLDTVAGGAILRISWLFIVGFGTILGGGCLI